MTTPVGPPGLQAFWNRRYGEDPDFVYGTAPNTFLVEASRRFTPESRILCLAEGEGRNAVWLARQGHRVTAVDVSDVGLRKAQQLAQQTGVRIETRVADVTAIDLGPSHWDAIVSIFLHLPAAVRRALNRRCLDALRAGGLVVLEAYGPRQLQYGTGGPPDPALLPSLDEVLHDFAGAEIVHRYAGARTVLEGKLHRGEGDVVQVIARRPI
jgi:SAM-dependent methyltransferase